MLKVDTILQLIKDGKVIPQEALPNIYDDHNPLEVSDYVDDIYQYYWVLEVRYDTIVIHLGKVSFG